MIYSMGWNFSFIHMPYGDAWRVHRRAFHGELHQRAVPAHQGAQLAASRRFVADCVLRPEDALHLSHLCVPADRAKPGRLMKVLAPRAG